MSEYQQTMSSIYTASINEITLDETPMAYKLMAYIIDIIDETVDIIEILKPVYIFKAN